MSDELEKVLRNAGYQTGPVRRPTKSTGLCVECGEWKERVNGVCIVCAVKAAPMVDPTKGSR